MALKEKSEIVRTLANIAGNSGEFIMRCGGLVTIVGFVALAVGYDQDERYALLGGGVLTGAGLTMLILGGVASSWGRNIRGAADKIEELNLN